MRIKRLDITGFKSFMDRSVFQFGEGVTGVVGPNGCGKSNVVDAIRWVMGEQSAKNLRGRGMEDVIFNGSETQAPLSMAEVTLTFAVDAVDVLPPTLAGLPEVSVTRRLFRSGESEYQINHTTCRLLDITELFLGTGVGTRAYSIIEQGRVGQIVSARPEDRRSFIEEAAGVTRYKARRKAAERKMEHTESNLLRVNDVVAELKGRLDSLDRQVKKAEKYKKLRSEMRQIELHTFSHRYLELLATRKVQEAQLGQLTADERASFEAVQAGEQAIALRRDALETETAQLEALAAQVHAIESQVALDAQSLEHSNHDLAATRARVAASQTEAVELSQRLEEAKAELASRQAEIDALTLGGKEDEVAVEVVHEELRRVFALTAEVAQRVERERAELVEVASRVANHEANLLNLQGRRAELDARIEKLKGEASVLRDEEAALERSREEVQHRVGHSRQAAQELSVRRSDEEQSLEQTREAFSENEIQVICLREELADKRSRLHSLEEIQRNYEGFDRGVRSVMLKAGDDPRSQGIWGLVSDVVSAPAEYEKAVEAVLAERLQYVVVDSSDRAFDWVSRLKDGAEGRSTFLPANSAAASLSGVVAAAPEPMLRLVRDEHAAAPEAHADGSPDLSTDGFVRSPDSSAQPASGEPQASVEATANGGAQSVTELSEASTDAPLSVASAHPDAAPSAAESSEASTEAHLSVASAQPDAAPSDAGAVHASTEPDASGEAAPAGDAGASFSAVPSVFSELPAASPDVAPAAGAVVRAVDVVHCHHPELTGLVQTLLDGVAFVADLAAAREAARLDATKIYVTREGEVLRPSGAVTGGALEGPAVGALQKKREIASLHTEVTALESRYNEIVTRHYELQKQMGHSEGVLKGLARNQHVEELSLAANEKDLHAAGQTLVRLRERLNALEAEVAQLHASLDLLLLDEEGSRGEVAHGQTDREAREERVRLLAGELETLKSRAEVFTAQQTALKVKSAAASEKIDADRRAVLQLTEAIADVEQRTVRCGEAQAEGQARSDELSSRIGEVEARQVEARAELAERQASLQTRREAQAASSAQVRDEEAALKELRARVDELTHGLSQIAIKERELTIELDHLIAQVSDRHAVSIGEAVFEFHLLAQLPAESEQRLKDLRGQVERMGEVNLTALEEHTEIAERYGFLAKQKEDLESSLEQLKDAIKKIDATSRERFAQTFEVVNEKFQQIFPRLFGGGRAGLVLTNEGPGQEPGVEIVAQPPGKKLQSVNLLSGGEKALTAVGMIFSIFLIKPTPFCLLDEVDAPLDEANVGRYNDMVREMSSQSQFILITHNKRTMEIVDNLYGVTMEEPGISKLVSVKIREASAANEDKPAVA